MPGNPLHIDTDQVQSFASQLVQMQDEIEQNTQRIFAEVSGLDWASQGRDSYLAEVEALVQQVRQMTEQGRQIAQRLNQEVAAWEAAAQTLNGAGSLSGGLNMIETGGGTFNPVSALPLVIPAIGIPAVILNPGIIGGVGEWITGIWSKLFPNMPLPGLTKPPLPGGWDQPATQPGNTPQPPAPAEPATPPAQPAQPAAPAAPAEPEKPSNWYVDVPTQNQHGLKYNGKDNLYGCAPTSASMILDYWHQQDPNNQTISAQDLLDKNVAEKEFDATGMSPTDLEDNLGDLGYDAHSYSADVLNPKDPSGALKDALANGPVMAVVRLGMNPNSPDVHAVVITGVSPDGKVRINDPWDGTTKEYDWKTFDSVWGSKFGQGSNSRYFTTIVPKKD